MATWRNNGYEKWKEDKEKNRGVLSKSPRNPIQYSNPSYRGESATRKESYQWEKDLLKDLPVKRYGRSYNDKFDRWAQEQGISSSEAREFRRWMDSKDDKVDTAGSATDRILSNMNKRATDGFERLKKREVEKKATQREEEKKQQEKKEKGSLANDFLSPLRNIKQALNPFDEVSFSEAFRNNVNDALDSNRSKVTKEATRALTRTGNTFTAGSLNQIYKKTHGEQAPQFSNEGRSGAGKVADFAYDALGYLGPGMLAYGALNASKAGKALTQLGSQGLKQRIGSEAAKGAITGGVLAGSEVGVREGLNPDDYSARDNLLHLGIGVGAGAVADPALYGLGRLAQSGLSRFAKGEVPTFSGGPSKGTLDRLRPANLPRTSGQSNDFFDRLATIRRTEPSENISPLRELEQARPEVAPTLQEPSLNRLRRENLRPGRDFEAIEPNVRGEVDEPELVRISPKERTDQLVNEAKARGNYEDVPNTMEQLTSKTKKDNVPFKQRTINRANQTYIDNVDNQYRLKQFTDDVSRKLGIEVKPEENPYMIGLNSRGSDQVSKQILTQNLVNHKGEVVGKSLKDVAMKVPKNKLTEFEDYLINKHAITRMDREEKVFANHLEMTPEKAAARVAKYETENPEFANIANEYYEYNKQLGEKWLVDTGIISKETWDGYIENNPYYVSNERFFTELEKGNQANQARRGYANQANPVKKGVGSQRKIISPFETTIERTAKYVKTARRNEVMQNLVQHIQKNPEEFTDWAEIVPTEKNPGAYMDSLENVLQKEGIEGVLDEFNKAFEQKPDLTHGNIVTGIIDGRKVHVKVNDPQLLEALTNLTPQGQGKAIELVGKVTRMMKTLTTGINPMFSLLRNVWRDIPQSYINSKSTNNPAVFTKDLALALVDVVGNRDAYRAFKAIGGGHSSPISTDVNLLAQSKREILGSKGLRTVPEKAISAIENLSNMVEAAPRLAEYKRITKNSNDYNSKIKGLYEANDITVNFNRYGNNIKQLDAIVPYLNAAVQGLDKFTRVYKDNPVQATVKTVLGVTVPTAIFHALNYQNDYENYKALPAYVRDTNYLFPLGDGQFIKIPKPRETGILASADFERIFMDVAENDPYAYEGFAKSVLNSFLPPTRLITAPLDDIRANKNFANIPIVSGNLEGLSPRYQYDETTSAPAKWIGDKMNVSPKELDYLVKSYTGVVGQLAIPATAEGSTIGETVKRQVVADSVYQNNALDRFYKFKEKLDTANKDNNAVGVQSEYYNKDLLKEFNTLSREMSDVRKDMKKVEKNEELSDKEKLERLRNLQKILNDIANEGNEMKLREGYR